MAASDNEKSRLDEAARAGWLYFIAGHKHDEIAKMLQVSRASAQRLVSLCLAERLITLRLEHPIAACMEVNRAPGGLRISGRSSLFVARVHEIEHVESEGLKWPAAT